MKKWVPELQRQRVAGLEVIHKEQQGQSISADKVSEPVPKRQKVADLENKTDNGQLEFL
jgi:hypothetical protein